MQSTNIQVKQQQHVNFVKFLAHKTLLSPGHYVTYSNKNGQQTQTRSRTEKKMLANAFLIVSKVNHFFVSAIYAVLSANALSALSTNFLTVFMRRII